MDISRRRFFVLPAAAILAGGATPALASIEAWFAPSARLWPRWEAHDPSSSREVDYAPWGGFLDRYLSEGDDGVARLPYGRIADADKRALETFLAGMAAEPVSRLSRAQQFAYWINLYNALTVAVVLRHYPVRSIRDINISPGLFASGPWDKALLRIEGESVSLNDIEHRILRPIWKDPHLHYAVNCASIGCPNLQREAYTPENVPRLLKAGASAYINHPRGVRIEKGRLRVSSMYVWFKEDFGGTDEGVIAHLARHAAPSFAAAMAGIREIDSGGYDWSLNEAA